EVIEQARENLDVSAQKAESYLKSLQTETRNAEDLRVALEEEREAVAYKYATLEIEAKKRERERQKQFECELNEIIAGFERQSKAFVQTIEDKALKAKLDKERLARKAELNRAVLANVERGMRNTESKTEGRNAESKIQNSAFRNSQFATIKIGSKVRTSFGNIGVVERMDKELAEVLVGGMRLREKISNLQAVVEEEKPKNQTLGEKLQNQTKGSNLCLDTEEANAELNLIGKTTSDAEYEIDRFLDEAYLAALPRVRIIHGFGTGALKNFVHHFLKGHPHIEKFNFAPPDQGGNGATIAELKQ
ncbi:MAG: Smr/MutS family protein, partial [Pyrinomonadaceae bacterium]